MNRESSQTPALLLSLLLGALIVGGCGGDGGGAADSGPAVDQSGQPDQGAPTPDQGEPLPDQGLPLPDQGGPAPDQGTPAPDGSTPTPDQGTPTPDQGTPTPDQGTPTPDQGTGPAAADRCVGATPVTLTGGTVTIQGDTSTLTDEYASLKCTTSALDGPQAYYRFAATKDQWYKLTLDPGFSAYLYVFTSTSCSEADIAADCGSGGQTGKVSSSISKDKPEAIYFKAPADGEVYVGVDSTSASGPFALTIETFSAPTNGTCAGAEVLSFTGGTAVATGDTGPEITPDEIATIKCGTLSAFDGPQAYYRLTAAAGKAYEITVTADAASTIYFYVFGASCSQGSIESDCASGGVSGAVQTASISGGLSKTIVFSPAAPGDYTIAVDSKSDLSYGGFTVRVDEFDPPANQSCATAELLTLSGGKVSVSASTTGATDEFATLQCKASGAISNTSALDGPQVYYRFAATKDQWYRVTLDSTFTAYVYAFTSSACTGGAIATDCQSQGATGEASTSIFLRKPEAIYVKAPADGEIYLAVDSTAPTNHGSFVLTIEQIATPANGACAQAEQVTLSGGSVKISGDLSMHLTPDEFAGVKCKGSGQTLTSTLDGPQAYYRFTANKDQWYKAVASADFTGYLYFFTGGCTEAGINTDCNSGGATGETSGSFKNADPRAVYFQAPADGPVHLAVDTISDVSFGRLSIELSTISAPTNGVCAAAKPLSLASGPAMATGDIGPKITPDQFPSIKCGKSSAFDGPQAYYRFTALAGKQYQITLTPTASTSLYFYVFGSGCAEADIEADCASTGTDGLVTTSVSIGSSKSEVFAPATGGNYTIAVDKTTASTYGEFTLMVEEL